MNFIQFVDTNSATYRDNWKRCFRGVKSAGDRVTNRVVILAGRRDILTEMCDMPDIEDKS
ncbi:MAG: hypothetical protein EZS28_010161, partial [Streblomastix strix]